jgi:hypothetical protein
MNKSLIFGIILTIISGIFLFNSVIQYMGLGFSGNAPEIEEFVLPIISGSVGIFFGFFLIWIGRKSSSP